MAPTRSPVGAPNAEPRCTSAHAGHESSLVRRHSRPCFPEEASCQGLLLRSRGKPEEDAAPNPRAPPASSMLGARRRVCACIPAGCRTGSLGSDGRWYPRSAPTNTSRFALTARAAPGTHTHTPCVPTRSAARSRLDRLCKRSGCPSGRIRPISRTASTWHDASIEDLRWAVATTLCYLESWRILSSTCLASALQCPRVCGVDRKWLIVVAALSEVVSGSGGAAAVSLRALVIGAVSEIKRIMAPYFRH